MPENASIWIAGLTFAAGVIAYAVKITWAIRDLGEGLRADMETRSSQRDQSNIERDATLRRELGETFHAQRTKIHEVEMWSRDTFVRKDSFELVVGRLESSIEKLGDRLENKLEKLVDKIQNGPAE